MTHTEMSTEMSTNMLTKILLKTHIKSNHEVDRMVTETDFEQRSLSQCQLLMTTGYNSYSKEHAEALHYAR
jgi:hypothetical protein